MAFKREKPEAVDEIVIDAEIAEPAVENGDGGRDSLPATRRVLPEATRIRAVEARRESETAAMRTVAVATAGGVVAGAATVVLARAAQKLSRPAPGLARRRRKDVVASRSFMVDVHMLKSQR